MRSLLIPSLLLLGATAAVAAPHAVKPHPAKKAAPALVCPITGEPVGSMHASGAKSVYKGKTYYFCCAACKPEFDKNPAAHVK